jgi:hypothetical protein
MSFDLWHTADPDAQADGGTLTPPDDGVYEVALVDAAAFTSKNGVALVKTAFKDVVSEYEWTVLHGFKSQAQANMTKKTCRSLGIDIDNITSQDQLDAAAKELIGRYFAVTVKRDGKFENTYIDGPTSGTPPQAAASAPAAATSTDDVPF